MLHMPEAHKPIPSGIADSLERERLSLARQGPGQELYARECWCLVISCIEAANQIGIP